MVKNLPCSVGDMGSIPGRETKMPQAAGQLIPQATTTEPMHHQKNKIKASVKLCPRE